MILKGRDRRVPLEMMITSAGSSLTSLSEDQTQHVEMQGISLRKGGGLYLAYKVIGNSSFSFRFLLLGVVCTIVIVKTVCGKMKQMHMFVSSINV